MNLSHSGVVREVSALARSYDVSSVIFEASRKGATKALGVPSRFGFPGMNQPPWASITNLLDLPLCALVLHRSLRQKRLVPIKPKQILSLTSM